MNFKDNFIRISTERFGGPYSLIAKGIKRGLITGILAGSMPSIDRAHEIAGVLGVTMEELLTGETTKKPPEVNHGGLRDLTKEEQAYTDKLVEILRGTNKTNVVAIKSNLDAFHKSRNMADEGEEDKKPRPLRRKAVNHE